MKNIKFYLLTACVLITSAMLHAQTVDSIINKYVDAIGGADKLSSVTSVIVQSTNEVMGNDDPATVTILNGKGYKSESDNNGQKYVQCFNEKGGWQIAPYTGSDDPQPMSDDQYKQGKDAMDVGGELFNYAAKGNKVELLGKEKSGNADVYKIKVTTVDSSDITYYLDTATYYVLKTEKQGEMMGQPVAITINFSDYRKTDFGVVMPYAYEMAFGEQFSVTVAVKQVDFNKPVDPSIFEMPKQ